ncbi:MAG: hypothetical protein EXQ92_07430 [Alphaproteobacteria bacterium]|nr:hypothetical protein [Alphaproteobacteria bacterium]
MSITIEAVIILALLVAPGFVCTRLVNIPLPSAYSTGRGYVILAFIFSLVVHMAGLPFTLSVAGRIVSFWLSLRNLKGGKSINLDWVVLGWTVSVLFVFPAILAILLSWLWQARWTQPALRHVELSVVQMISQAWDWVFLSQQQGCWAVAELDDGRRIAGEYGPKSFASLSPYGKDMFIEAEYEIDEQNNIGERIQDSVGVWINGDKVRALHLYRAGQGG